MSKYYAMDCEMVGSYNKSILARVSIVDARTNVVLDAYVKPTAEVTDHRYPYSGITPEDLENGMEYERVRDMVIEILSGNILIGHSLHFDLAALNLQFPEENIRDLAKMPAFLRPNGQSMSLRELAKKYLGRDIQVGTHCSVEDATAAMEIYLKEEGSGYCVIL